jgi:flagellar basal-body rod protein FlgG
VDKNGGLTRGSGTLIQGMLEASNVDLAQEMTKVIEAQRAYTMALKMMTTSDEIESTINGLRG